MTGRCRCVAGSTERWKSARKRGGLQPGQRSEAPEGGDLALEVAIGNLNREATGCGEGGLVWPRERGQCEGFCLGARVHHGLPDHVVARAGARLCGAVLDALQDDAGIGAGFFSYASVEGGCAAIAHLGALQELVMEATENCNVSLR